MKWIQTPEGDYVLKLSPGGEPLPIFDAGMTQNHLWAFTGDFSHLLRFGGATWVEDGPRAGHIEDASGRTLAWVNTLEDTPEIIDKDQWRLEKAQIEEQMDTEEFRAWLDEEVEITT